MANETNMSHPAKLNLLSNFGLESDFLDDIEICRKHTSIHVPKVLNVYHHRDGLYLEMGYVSGIDLRAAWLGGCLSEDQKRHIITEVTGYVSQLRSFEPPRKGIVGSADLGACLDHLVGSCTFDPFNEHAEFHSFLRRHIRIENCTQVFGEEVTECHSRHYRRYFTHTDLCPRNIIIENGKASATIDWEFGGWYPEYWKYTKAQFGQIEMPEWYEGLASAMARYDIELRAERVLWKRCDLPGMLL
ncbi:kinase-like protein [Aspergillus pseudonomiae]|nr:kinase-like protein [Aspergillus pseudonomiae]